MVIFADDRTIGHKLVEMACHNAKVDWTLKEGTRAHLRTVIKRLLLV